MSKENAKIRLVTKLVTDNEFIIIPIYILLYSKYYLPKLNLINNYGVTSDLQYILYSELIIIYITYYILCSGNTLILKVKRRTIECNRKRNK